MSSPATLVRTIVHLSDTHILPDPDDRPPRRGYAPEPADILQRLTESEMHVDAVILSGDLADGGQPASYQRLRPLLDALDTRVIVAIGNHDARPASARSCSTTANPMRPSSTSPGSTGCV